MTTTLHFVIPDPNGDRILLIGREGPAALPSMPAPSAFEERFEVSGLSADIRARVGLDVAVLRTMGVGQGKGDDGYTCYYTENLTNRSPFAGEWCDERDVQDRALEDERDRIAIRRWFAERRGGPPPRLQPWQRAGWFHAAEGWIRSTLPGVTSVEQFTTCSTSSLLRIEANGRRLYFKASPDFFRSEPVVTAALAKRFPSSIPDPVAIDEERSWMILWDFGDHFVRDMPVDAWEASLDALLEIHRAGRSQIDALLEVGCRDRRPTLLGRRMKELAAEGSDLLPKGTIDRLRATAPRFSELIGDLERAPIPDTLVHGDFHAGNVVMRDGRPLIFDWTDACIAHPFVDLATYLHMFGPPSTDPVVRARLRDRYLGGWSDLIPLGEAVTLFERVEPVTLMHHAVTYLDIIEGLDPAQRWEWSSHLPWWFDKALEAPERSVAG